MQLQTQVKTPKGYLAILEDNKLMIKNVKKEYKKYNRQLEGLLTKLHISTDGFKSTRTKAIARK